MGQPPNGGNPGGRRIFAPNLRPIPALARLTPQTRPRSARNRRHSLLVQRLQTTATGEVCPPPTPRRSRIRQRQSARNNAPRGRSRRMGSAPYRQKIRRKADFHPKPPPDPRRRPAKSPNPAPIRAESPIQPPRATPSNNGRRRGLPKTARHHQRHHCPWSFRAPRPVSQPFSLRSKHPAAPTTSPLRPPVAP
jgi:hypothetical protein